MPKIPLVISIVPNKKLSTSSDGMLKILSTGFKKNIKL